MFKKKFYQQVKGVPIGSPMVGILAELIVRSKETLILKDFANDYKFYKRYVDDVLVIWKKNDRSEDLENAFTDMAYGLALKTNQIDRKTVHFLDIWIKVEQTFYSAKIYQKPTVNHLIIPYWSEDPISNKKAAFYAYFKRSITHTNITERQEEEITNC